MQLTGDTIKGLLASIGPTIASVLQLTQSLLKRLHTAAGVERKVRDLGPWFRWICYYPALLTNFIVGTILLLSVVSLGVGTAKVMAEPAQIDSFRHRHPSFAHAETLFKYSPILFLVYIVLAVAFHLEILPQLALALARTLSRVRPRIQYDPGFICATEFVKRGDEKARLINVDRENCTATANALIRLVTDPTVKLHDDYADLPAGLSASERANVLLIGNVVEGCIRSLGAEHSAKKIRFGAFYSSLAQAGLTEARLFDPVAIRANANPTENIFQKLSLAAPGLLPDEAIVRTDVNDAVRQLASSFNGDAARLAHTMFGPSASSALRHAQAFPEMRSDFNTMAVQFVKLAIDADVWPGIDPGPFVYPFSKRLTVFLLNAQCLITAGDNKEIAIDEALYRLSANAVATVVEQFTHLVKRDQATNVKEWVRKEFGTESQNVHTWDMARSVDYYLWELSRKPELLGGGAEKGPWRVEGNFLRRG